jgi:transposase
VCLGGVEDEEHISQCEVLQSCRKTRKKRALIAVGHKILIIVYYILKTGMPYKELGKNYLSRGREDKLVKDHIRRLKDLGYEVALKKAA